MKYKVCNQTKQKEIIFNGLPKKKTRYKYKYVMCNCMLGK